jgi:hypothetical protein
MSRVDLDEIERQLEDRQGVSATDVLDAIAELRAAREVVEAARAAFGTETQYEHDEEYVRVLRAYDQAVGP